VLYCTVLHCTVLHCAVLHCTVLHCTVLHCTVLYCTVLYCTALYSSVLYCTMTYCTVLHCITLHCAVLYCTVLCCTAVAISSTFKIPLFTTSFLSPFSRLFSHCPFIVITCYPLPSFPTLSLSHWILFFSFNPLSLFSQPLYMCVYRLIYRFVAPSSIV
jgi:hypothetical protein